MNRRSFLKRLAGGVSLLAIGGKFESDYNANGYLFYETTPATPKTIICDGLPLGTKVQLGALRGAECPFGLEHGEILTVVHSDAR